MSLRMRYCVRTGKKMAYDQVFHLVVMFKDKFSATLKNMSGVHLHNMGKRESLSFSFGNSQVLIFNFSESHDEIIVECDFEFGSDDTDAFVERVAWLKSEMEVIRAEERRSSDDISSEV